MYERMLDKQHCPSPEEMRAFCGENARRFDEINALLQNEFQTETTPAFPYGNHYGWCVAHRRKGRLCCNVFPEDGAFTVMLRLSDAQCRAAYVEAGPFGRALIDEKYPCGDGGWIHCRGTDEDTLAEAWNLICARFGKGPKGAN